MKVINVEMVFLSFLFVLSTQYKTVFLFRETEDREERKARRETWDHLEHREMLDLRYSLVCLCFWLHKELDLF